MNAALRLEVEGLALERGGARLAGAVSFRAGPGEYVEIVGPNGAGKTTLLRTLAGLVKPAEGRITLASNLGPLAAEDRAASLHLLGHRDGLKGALDVSAHVRFWEALYGGTDRAGTGRAETEGPETEGTSVLALLGLEGLSARPAATLSAGQARRLALARLLIAPRPLWLLDEPAAGLDLEGRARLLGLVGDHLEGGGIVVAAVHEPIGAAANARVSLPGAPAGGG